MAASDPRVHCAGSVAAFDAFASFFGEGLFPAWVALGFSWCWWNLDGGQGGGWPSAPAVPKLLVASRASRSGVLVE